MRSISLSKFDLFALLGIFLVSFLSTGRIINYYFFYDDFFLFYALQFPNDRNSILTATDASGYRFLQPFFSPLFHVFGYEAKGYFIISFVLFVLFAFSFYLCLRLLFPKTKKVALFSSLILASSYIGIEALTWNMGAGPNNTIFLSVSLISLCFLASFVRERRATSLFGFFITFIATIYYFQFRSFLLFAWVPILVISIGNLRKKRLLNLFLNLFPIIFTLGLGVLIYTESFGLYPGQGAHLSLNTKQFIEVYFRNIANIFSPSDFLDPVVETINISARGAEVIIGGLITLFIVLITALSFLKRTREFHLFLFFSLSTISSLFLLQLVTSLTVVAPTVWYSSHRFYIVITPFIAGFLGTLLFILQKRYKSLAILLLGLWIATHIILSNQVISTRWENTISHIEYFYKTLKTYVPKMNDDSVLLITQGEPTPVSIFVSARDANAFAGPAGFYGKTVDNFNLLTSPMDAVLALRRLGASEEKLYALHYRRGELIDVTPQTRELLKTGKTITLGSDLSGHVIEFDGISLPTSVPMYLDMQFVIYPDLSNVNLLRKANQQSVEHPERYFEILFKQTALSLKTSANSKHEPLSFEHEASNVADGDYSTTWIPKKWDKDGVYLIVDLGVEKSINRIIWSSSRTSSWYGRLPSDYEIEVSRDGSKFVMVHKVESAPALATGEFFVDEIPEQIARFIRITVYKTKGGLTPAIDEVEIFSKEDGDIDFTKYFTLKQNPERYFPNKQVADRYLRETLRNTLDLEITWRVDENTDYPSNRVKVVPVEVGKLKNINTILPIGIGRELKSLRVKVLNFPAEIRIIKAELVYPRLSSFKE